MVPGSHRENYPRPKDDALWRACQIALEPGRDLLVATPTFAMLPRYARLLGAHVHYNTSVVSARRTGGAWVVTAADGRTWRASALVMCTGQEGTSLHFGGLFLDIILV